MAASINKLKETFLKGFTIDLSEPLRTVQISKFSKALGFVEGEGTFNADQVVSFLTTDQSRFLRHTEIKPMKSNTVSLENISDQTGNVRRVEPGVELTISGTITETPSTLTAEPLMARYFLSYDWLNENALTANSEDEVLALVEADLVQAYHNDIAQLAITGSSDGGSAQASTLVASLDGFLAAAIDNADVVKATGSVFADEPNSVNSALRAAEDNIPDKYQGRHDQYVHFVEINAVRQFRRFLQDSGSAGDLSHLARLENNPLSFEGVPLEGTQFMPDRWMLSTFEGNMVYGLGNEMTVKFNEEPGKFGWDIFVYSKGGFQFNKPEAVVLTRPTGSEISAWAASGTTI